MRRRSDTTRRAPTERDGPRRSARAVPSLQRPASHRHGPPLELQWPSHPVYPQYGYVVRRRDLDTIVARTPWLPGRRCSKVTTRCSPSSTVASCAALSCSRRPASPRDPRPLRRRGRRGQQPLRSLARHVPHPGMAVRHRHSHLLGDTPARRGPTRSTARRVGGSPSRCEWPCRTAIPGCGTCRASDRTGCWPHLRRST